MAAITITADNYQDILNTGKPAMLDFGAVWCPHCKRIGPSVDKLADEYADKLTVGKVDSDEDPAIAAKYEVEYLPTFVLINPDGSEIAKMVGASGKADLEKFIASNLSL